MKKSLLASLLVLTGISAITSATAATYTTGDALVFFRATGGTGSDKNVVIDVGNLFSPFTGYTINQSASNSILSTTYGANWWTRNNLYWGTIGSYDGSTSLDTVIGLNAGNSSAVSSTTVLDASSLSSISGWVNNVATAAGQGGATQTGVVTSLSATNYASIFANSYSGSVTQADTAPNFWGNFSSSLGSVASAFQSNSVWAYTLDYNSANLDPLPNAFEANTSIADGIISVAPAAVPEPSTYALMGLGAAVLFLAVRRRKATVKA